MLEFVAITVLLFLAALTAASETSLIAVSRLRLRRLAADGSRAAKIILKILETPERFFGTILVVNNVVDTLLAAIVTVILVHFFGEARGIVLATIVAALLIIIFEVTAKTLAAVRAEKMSLALARFVRWLIALFSPVVKVIAFITNTIIAVIAGPVKHKATLVSEEEIRALIKIGEEDDPLHREKYRMLSRVFAFSETVVRSVMTPKPSMVAIDVAASIDDILVRVLESGYSRLPVYRDTPDHIIGTVNMKDLLNLSLNRDLVLLGDIIYPPTFVLGSRRVTDLLKEFQKGHTHLAIVVDDRGKVEGLVTLEDLLEEIVGEIQDEYDIRSS